MIKTRRSTMITAQAVSSLLLIEIECFLQEPFGFPYLPKNAPFVVWKSD